MYAAKNVATESLNTPNYVLALRHHLQPSPMTTRTNLSAPSSSSSQIRLILASVSPRRQEILEFMGLQGRFETIPSPLNESALQLELTAAKQSTTDSNSTRPVHTAQEYTRILAQEKARALARTLVHPCCVPTLVLGSDTIVELDRVILEKPRDAADAKRMLRRLSGRDHCVHTGVALYQINPSFDNNTDNNNNTDNTDSNILLVSSFTDTAVVQFADLSNADIEAYVATQEPMDKAGSYGIQGIGGQFVTSVRGDFFTVMGLPMNRVSRELCKAIREIIGLAEDGQV